MRIIAVTAGLRQPSSSRLLTDRLVSAVAAELPDAEIEVVELREYARSLTNQLLTGVPDQAMSGLLSRIGAADALIAVSPIFSGSYSGLFKSLFDVLEVGALTGTPVLIAATGGTARHSLALDHALRPLFAYLRAVVVPTGVYAAPEDWGSAVGAAADADRLDDRVARAARELAALVRLDPRPAAPPVTEPEVVDFETLLRGYGGRS